MTYLNLRACGLGEWESPDSAAAADYGSLTRLQAAVIAACLALANSIWEEEDRMVERRLKQQFDLYQKVGILVASKLRAERGEG